MPTVHDLRFILEEESEKKIMKQQWLQDLAEALLIGVSIGAAIAIAYWTAAAFQGMIERMSIL
jgi:alpha-beta hydrolase superfamily lysophospholipase